MTGEVLLDTSVVVAFFRGDAAVTARMAERSVCLPATAAGELLFGALKSRRAGVETQSVLAFIGENSVLETTVDTAIAYARIRLELQLAGKPISENDIWIAASAIQHGLPLATRDEHFRAIEHLQIEWW